MTAPAEVACRPDVEQRRVIRAWAKARGLVASATGGIDEDLVHRWCQAAGVPPRAISHRLHPSDLPLLRLVAEGAGNPEIGIELGIGLHAVKNRLKALYAALDARDRAHAVSIAYQLHLIPVGGCRCPEPPPKPVRIQVPTPELAALARAVMAGPASGALRVQAAKALREAGVPEPEGVRR